LYLDTSALAKLYLEEEGSDQVREWTAAAEALATSRVALAELAAAIARRRREGGLTDDESEAIRSAMTEDWNRLVVVHLDEHRAADVAFAHELRGFDAIHLAAALEVRDALGDIPVCFSCFDQRLSRAASAQGFDILGAES
jgi:predicted nucleic acid-binding protein